MKNVEKIVLIYTIQTNIQYSNLLKQKQREIKNLNQMQLFEFVQEIQNSDSSQ